MNVNLKQHRNTLIVSLKGELDHHCAKSIREKLDDEISRGIINNIILDCSDLSFMDSSGIGMILGRYKKIVALGGKFIATNISPQVKRIFTISGLDRIIEIHATTKTALKNI